MSRVARAPMVRASMLCPLWGRRAWAAEHPTQQAMEVEAAAARPGSMLEALDVAVTAISRGSGVLYPMSGSPSSKQGHADPLCRPGAATGVYKVAEPSSSSPAFLASMSASRTSEGSSPRSTRSRIPRSILVTDRPSLEMTSSRRSSRAAKVTPGKRECTHLGAVRT